MRKRKADTGVWYCRFDVLYRDIEVDHAIEGYAPINFNWVVIARTLD